jgi:hypothetical protein
MSNHGKNHQKHSPAVTNFIKLLYANKVTALALHFSLNALIAIIFAIVFTLQLNLEYTGFKILLVAMFAGSIIVSIKSCVNVPAYRGYLINFLGAHTEVVLENGYWPMILYPLIRLEPSEEVDFQKEDVDIPMFIVPDTEGNMFEVSGILPYNVDEEGGSTFTALEMKTFKSMAQLMGRNCAWDIINTSSYYADNSPIRSLEKFNARVLEKLDTSKIKDKFGIDLDTPILTINLTKETLSNFNIKSKTLQEVMANRQKGMGFAELLAEFKKKMQASGMKYSDKELQAAVLKAINGVYIYDFGSSDGASHKFLNISPTMPKS